MYRVGVADCDLAGGRAVKFMNIGQNTVGVKIQMRRNMITGNHNQKRYSNRVFHPVMSAPSIPATISRLNGWKKSPGFIG